MSHGETDETTVRDEDASDPPKGKAKKKKKDEPAKPLPGAGTRDGDKLREAVRAFEVGDYTRVRARVRELEQAEDADVRAFAIDLRTRISIDPVHVIIVAACALALVFITYHWVL